MFSKEQNRNNVATFLFLKWYITQLMWANFTVSELGQNRFWINYKSLMKVLKVILEIVLRPNCVSRSYECRYLIKCGNLQHKFKRVFVKHETLSVAVGSARATILGTLGSISARVITKTCKMYVSPIEPRAQRMEGKLHAKHKLRIRGCRERCRPQLSFGQKLFQTSEKHFGKKIIIIFRIFCEFNSFLLLKIFTLGRHHVANRFRNSPL